LSPLRGCIVSELAPHNSMHRSPPLFDSRKMASSRHQGSGPQPYQNGLATNGTQPDPWPATGQKEQPFTVAEALPRTPFTSMVPFYSGARAASPRALRSHALAQNRSSPWCSLPRHSPSSLNRRRLPGSSPHRHRLQPRLRRAEPRGCAQSTGFVAGAASSGPDPAYAQEGQHNNTVGSLGSCAPGG